MPTPDQATELKIRTLGKRVQELRREVERLKAERVSALEEADTLRCQLRRLGEEPQV